MIYGMLINANIVPFGGGGGGGGGCFFPWVTQPNYLLYIQVYVLPTLPVLYLSCC